LFNPPFGESIGNASEYLFFSGNFEQIQDSKLFLQLKLHGTPRNNKKTTTAQQTKQPGDDKSRKKYWAYHNAPPTF